MMRWVALQPGQRWITGAQETIKIVDNTDEGEIIFEVYSPNGRLTNAGLVTPYADMKKFLEVNEGALFT